MSWIGLLIAASAPASFVEARATTSRMWEFHPGTAVDANGDMIHGVTAVEILVSPAGRAIRCTVVHRSPKTPLGDWACPQILRNARFPPARDRARRPIHSVFTYWFARNLYDTLHRVENDRDLWIPVNRLPAGVRRPKAELRYLVGSDGQVEACEASRSSGARALDQLGCEATRRMSFIAVEDETGAAVRTVRTRKIGFQVRADPAP